MKRLLNLLIIISFSGFLLANEIIQTTFLKDKHITISVPTDFHITAHQNPLVNSTIEIQNADVRLFFDNVRPATVLNEWATFIKINGEILTNKNNAQILIYKQGTVIVPHKSDYKAFIAYAKDHYQGEKLELAVGENNNLGTFNNNIRSFVLKRGYMATLANENTGLGYSRVFVADDNDIEMSVAPGEFYGKISYIRIFRWNYVSKKGWCTSAGDYDWQAGRTESTWFYSWSADKSTTLNCDYTVIKQHLYWPGWSDIYKKSNVCNLMGYNEPEHSEQHEAADCSCGGIISADKAVAQWPDFMKSGMRLGSPCPTDMSWLYDFVNKIDAKGYRLDYVAIHAYWGGLTATQWYNQLKTIYDKTKRPIWITEWNNGANWTTESWPSDGNEARQKQLTELKAILTVLDTASFIERYSIYNWVGDNRRMIWDDGYPTPAGFYYKDNHPTFGYAKSRTYIPTINISKPTLAVNYDSIAGKMLFTITDNNAELTDQYTLQLKQNGLYTQYAKLAERVYDHGTATATFGITSDKSVNGTFRLKMNYCNGKVIYSSEVPFTTLSNNLADGDYFIVNADNNAYLTNTEVLTPLFKEHTTTDSAAQVWNFAYDTDVKRYKITSKKDNRYLNENAKFSTADFYKTWNTYNLYNGDANKYVIQNGGSAGNDYWTLTSTNVTGKGSSTMPDFPFLLIHTSAPIAKPEYQKNTLASGFFEIINAEDSSFLTNTGSSIPTFLPENRQAEQVWQIMLDTMVGRYIIYSCKDGRFLNEYGQFATYDYSAAYHTYNIYNTAHTQNYIIQNTNEANNPNYYWAVNGNSILGKGSTRINCLPFILRPTNAQLQLAGKIQIENNNAKTTNTILVSANTNITLIPQPSIAGGTYSWDTGESTDKLVLNNVQQSGTYTVTYTLGNLSSEFSFTVNVYTQNQLANGDYFIKNPSDGSFLTVYNREAGPEFTGRNIYDRNTQLWTISKDGTTGRYKIVNKKDKSFILNEFALYTGTYYPAWNTYTLYQLTGTNRYAVQNGGSSGTAYWQILDNIIIGKGVNSLQSFPFQITTFAEEETPEFDALTYIQQNDAVAELTDSMVVPIGTTVTLTYQSTTPNAQFLWSNGATTENIVFENLQENIDLTVTCTFQEKEKKQRFVVMVYTAEKIADGKYFIQNASDHKYLTASALALPAFADRNENKTNAQLWMLTYTNSSSGYKITSVNDNRYLGANGRLSSDEFIAAENTYKFYRIKGTSRFAIQNLADHIFWQISGNKISIGNQTTPDFCYEMQLYDETKLHQTTLEGLFILINPIKDKLLCQLPQDAKLEIISLSGAPLGTWNCHKGLNTILLDHLASGSYIGIFSTASGKSTSVKIIKL